MMAIAVVLSLIAPFLGGVGMLLIPARLRTLFVFVLVSTLIGATGYLATGLTEVLRFKISGWDSPLGISFHVDGIGVVMMLLTTTILSAIALYSIGYFKDTTEPSITRGFWSLFFLLWGSLNAIFLVSDLFTLYVCLELITFASVALITLAHDRDALKAALTYLMTALMGSLAYLLGVALIYSKTGTLDWTLVSVALSNDSASWIALSMMTAGLVIKAALFPLHFWLPGAHAIAPAPVSALLSALVVKSSFFVIMRLWVQVYPDVPYAAHVLGALGAGAVVWGSFQAIIQERVKLMVAYSTVAQIGYLFLVFPLLSAASDSSDIATKSELWEGTIYFAISHGVAKAAMFLVAGIVLQATDTDYLRNMQGAAARVPISVFAWGLAGISLIGLPPSGGFIAKWQLLTSAIRVGQWPYVGVILFGGLLASGYVFRVLWYAFLAPEKPRPIHRVPTSMLVAAIFLGIVIVAMGVRTADIYALLKIGSPFTDGGKL